MKFQTYFVPEEGFLAGLALNNENVTFNDGYKNVLRFYGFDMDNNDQLPTLAPTNGTNETTTVAPGTTTAMPAESATTSAPMTSESPPAREDTSSTLTTLNPNAETISDVDIRGLTPTLTTTVGPSSAPNAESTTVLTAISLANDETNVPAEGSSETTAQSSTETAQAATNTTPMMTEAPMPEELATSVPSVAPTETEPTPSTTLVSTAAAEEPTVNNEVDVLTTPDMSTIASQSTAAESTILSTTENIRIESTTISTSETQQTETVPSTAVTADPTTVTSTAASTIETLERKKKSIVDFIYKNPPYVDDYLFYRSYDIPIAPDAPPSPNVDNSMFLVNGLRNVQVSFKKLVSKYKVFSLQ